MPTTADVPTTGDLPRLTVLRGDEPLLVSRAISRVTRAVRRVEPDAEVRSSEGRDTTPGSFADLVAPSLFAEPRLVIVRSANECAKDTATAIARYAADPVDGVWLVVHHSGGARNKALTDSLGRAGAAVITCAKITKASDRIAFVRHEIKAAGGTASEGAVTALVDAVGTDLAELASAASQLVADTGGLIDDAAVRRYHRGRAAVNGYAIADLVVAGNAAGALEALRWAWDVGVPDVVIADALADGIRTLARVASSPGGNSYQLASQWGMPPWKIDRARVPARGWSAAGLTAAIKISAILNAQVKGRAADPHYALERAVIDLVRVRSLT